MLPLIPRFHLINCHLMMNLAPFQIEGVKRFRIVLCRVILLLLILRCFFVILCLREEALLQIGVIEE